MGLIDIAGIAVDFPYDPYPCQVAYMEKVVNCLQNGWNGLLESPTGTGKTLCLLCACLAWTNHHSLLNSTVSGTADVVTEQHNQLKTSETTGHESVDQSKLIKPAIKIIYTSRTHSQLQQVVRELNKTVYAKSVKVGLLASRDQTCVNPEVAQEQNSSLKNNLCRAKISNRSCEFHRNLEDGKYLKSEFTNSDKVLDIEDIVRIGKKVRICPFYKAREAHQSNEANLLLVPYNYVLDSMIRKMNKLDLAGNILIFDEAHNLQKVCEDSVSCSFGTRALALCIKEAQQVLDYIQVETEDYRKIMDETAAPFGKVDTSNAPDQTIKVNELAHLITFLKNLEREFDKLSTTKTSVNNTNSNSKLSGITHPGSFIYELLDRAEIFPEFKETLCSLIDQSISYLADKVTSSVWQSRGTGLQQFSTFLSNVFPKDMRGSNASGSAAYKEHTKYFRVYLCNEKDDELNSTSNNTTALVIHIWCFSAHPGMQHLVELGLRSTIVTSGTLAPLNHFISELGIPFREILENEHVISPGQVLASIIKSGPDSQSISMTYGQRGNTAMISSLGNTILNLARNIPQGMLIFFASYSQMNRCIEFWKESNLFNRINSIKPIVIEPKAKGQLTVVQKQFEDYISNTDLATDGAIFMAVCRGKVSEGVDFSDSSGRAVLLVGIPYPPLMDPKVVLKQAYLTESKNKLLTAAQWYELEAARAINQALGRIIRHKEDFGSIILIDERFSRWSSHNFPKWIRGQVRSHSDFSQVISTVSQFFKSNRAYNRKTYNSNFTVTVNQKGDASKILASDAKTEQFASKCFVRLASTSNCVGLMDTANIIGPVDGLPCEYSSFSDKLHSGIVSTPSVVDSSSALDIIESRSSTITNDNHTKSISIRSGHQLSSSIVHSNQPTRKRIKITRVSEATIDHGTSSSSSSTINELEPKEFSRLLKLKLSKDEMKSFSDAMQFYQSGDNLQNVIPKLESLFLPNQVDLLKGICSFLKKKDRNEFTEYLKTLKK